MLHLKSKITTLPLYFCVLSALLSPSLAQAELGGSGSKAANQAAEQRAVRAEKIEKKKKEAEAKAKAKAKAAGVQQEIPAETQTPVQEKPAVQ